MNYEYENNVDFRGDPAKAMEAARERLEAMGFKVIPPAANQLHFVNPGSYLNTKKQPLLMVSRGSLTATGTALLLHAELDNLRQLVRFLALLVGVMAIPETALVAVLLAMVAKQPALLPLCLLSLLPIPIILFLMPRIQRRSTGRALDSLLAEAASGEVRDAGAVAAAKGGAVAGKRYWFRAKRTGWGWDLPLTWEGWVTGLGIAAALVCNGVLLAPSHTALHWVVFAVLMGALVGACVLKGEPPGRR